MKFAMIHHVDQNTIDEMYRSYRAVFVLSTGRSGSKFVTEILALSPQIEALHEGEPTLQYFSNFAFHHQAERSLLIHMANAARMEKALSCMIRGKIYAESNHCLSFFAPALAELFRGCVFVHLVRHPGDFVCSAARKGFHRNDSIWEAGRARMPDDTRWHSLDQIEKLAWVWSATNSFLETFKATLEETRIMTLRLEDLSATGNEPEKLLRFAGGTEFCRERIASLQKIRFNTLTIAPDEPPNMKKDASFPQYGTWPDEWRDKLKGLCGEGAAIYGYQL